MAEPVRVRDLLARLPGMADCLAEAWLVAAWPEVAGPAAARTRAQEIEDGVLHVAVESSGWLHRLTLEEPALLARCRALAPRLALRGIRFHLASLAPPLNAVGERHD
jgi:predicted nucleic acid-binding Zn ribbon protein